MEHTEAASDSARSAVIADARFRARLEQFVRRRVPASDVDDVVQAALTDALAARHAPATASEIQRWVFGIARHKMTDLHRRGAREALVDEAAPRAEALPTDDDALGARDLLRWAERELPESEGAERTLGWLLREGEGEKLEHIARAEALPSPRVRQRITRLRKHFRERWSLQWATLLVLALLVGAGVWCIRRFTSPLPTIAREPTASKLERARLERRRALDDCRDARYRQCLDGLDRARTLDPSGDGSDAVKRARVAASKALAPTEREAPSPVVPSDPVPAPAPSAVLAPRPPPAPTVVPAPTATPSHASTGTGTRPTRKASSHSSIDDSSGPVK